MLWGNLFVSRLVVQRRAATRTATSDPKALAVARQDFGARPHGATHFKFSTAGDACVVTRSAIGTVRSARDALREIACIIIDPVRMPPYVRCAAARVCVEELGRRQRLGPDGIICDRLVGRYVGFRKQAVTRQGRRADPNFR